MHITAKRMSASYSIRPLTSFKIFMANRFSINKFVGGMCYLGFFVVYNILFSFVNIPPLINLFVMEPIYILLSYISTGFFLRKIGFWKY